jgi:acyl-CoA thioesterase-1
MPDMAHDFISRRAVIAAGGLALAPAAQAAATPRVAILGDSITSGYGLPASQALPSRLQVELARMGVPARIIPAGRSGETTAGGAARVDRAIPAGVAVCVVALGGNDLLNGADPTAVKANLDRIVRRLKARRVTVVLAGVRAPPLLDGRYVRAFNGAFASVAAAQGVIFLPDLLEGVVLNPRLNQPDGIHPNAAGVTVIARRLAPLVARGLAAR